MGFRKQNFNRGFGGRRNFHGRFDNRRPPVKEGDELELTIETIAEKGDGLAKKDGFVIFVPNTKQGEKVRVRITRVLRRVGFAEKIGEATETKEVSNSTSHSNDSGGSDESRETPQDSENFGEESNLDSEDF